MDPSHEETLRRLAVLDDRTVADTVPSRDGEAAGFVLDARTTALVRLAGLVALQTSPQAYEWGVAAVLGAGADHEDIVAVLISLLPVVGSARVSCAADAIATAVGCDLDAQHDR